MLYSTPVVGPFCPCWGGLGHKVPQRVSSSFAPQRQHAEFCNIPYCLAGFRETGMQCPNALQSGTLCGSVSVSSPGGDTPPAMKYCALPARPLEKGSRWLL